MNQKGYVRKLLWPDQWWSQNFLCQNAEKHPKPPVNTAGNTCTTCFTASANLFGSLLQIRTGRIQIGHFLPSTRKKKCIFDIEKMNFSS